MRHVLSHGGHYLAVIVLCLACVRPLAAARWPATAPRLAILVWQALLASVWSSAVGAALSIGVAPYRTGELRGVALLLADLRHSRLPTEFGAAQWVALAFAALLSTAFAALVTRHAIATAATRLRHRRLLDIVATPSSQGLVILPHGDPVAYCLPGRRPRLVVSTGALAMLDPAHLDAVLRHERAHAIERHDLILLPFAALRAIRLPVARTVWDAVSVLVEMRADDRAAAAVGRPAVHAALSRFVGLTAVVPVGALGATAALAARLRRLAAADLRLNRRSAGAIIMITLTVATTPLSLLLYPW